MSGTSVLHCTALLQSAVPSFLEVVHKEQWKVLQASTGPDHSYPRGCCSCRQRRCDRNNDTRIQVRYYTAEVALAVLAVVYGLSENDRKSDLKSGIVH